MSEKDKEEGHKDDDVGPDDDEYGPEDIEYSPDADIDMEDVDDGGILVGQDQRNAFLGLTPNPKIEKKTRMLGGRTARLDRLEYSGQLIFSGQSEVLHPRDIRQKLEETFHRLVYQGSIM